MIACEIRGLTKAFGRNRVLRGIDLNLNAGEVVVLMGANGAGKSTLVKVLCGFHQADSGQVTLAGDRFAPLDAADAIARGVVTVHQSIDDGVVAGLDVATNLMLNRLTQVGAGLFVRDRHLRRAAQKVADTMGLTVDLRARVADLSVADRQVIAIARAMAYEPKVLILDEPTSSLSATEADRLFRLIDRLRSQGVAILYISHRMSDIRRIADRIICMRDGAIAGTFDRAPLDYDGAVAAMLGHTMTDVNIEPRTCGKVVLELDNVVLKDGSEPISLQAQEGEVIAITGLLGSGKSKLADIIFGLQRPVSGNMRLDGKSFAPTSATEAIGAGVFMSPKDRSANAVIPAFDIANNMTLPFLGSFSRLSLLSGRNQRAVAESMIAKIGVVCQSNRDGIGTLSGGNQQKVMIGRWLLEGCRVLLLDEPFQGVDIGARRDIGHYIRETADGRTTLVFAAELDEAFEIADRIIVLNEGSVVGTHLNFNVDLEAIIAQVSGTTVAPTQAN
jgi:simple sugar transport system ATP-binding protein